MAYLANYTKQPADTLDYDCDCSEWLNGDTIQSVVSTVTPVGLSVTSIPFSANTYVKHWVSSGVAATTYKVETTVTSVLGRIKQYELRIKVKEV